MSKKVIKINERAIKNIVGESLKRVLKESMEDEGIRDLFKRGNNQQPQQQPAVPQQQATQQENPQDERYVYLVVDVTVLRNAPLRLIDYGKVPYKVARSCNASCHGDRDAYAHIFETESEYWTFIRTKEHEGYDIKKGNVENNDAQYWRDRETLFGNSQNGSQEGVNLIRKGMGQMNESQLNKIVANTVRKVLKENMEDEGRFLNWLGLGNRRNAQQPQPVQPQQQMQGQEGEGGTCPKCGNQTRPGARFCNKCGENLTGESSFCKYCGKPKKPNQKFCSHCGKYIENPQGQQVNEGVFDRFKGNNFNMSLYQMGQYVGGDAIQFSRESNTYRYHGKDLLDYCSNNKIIIDGVDTHIGPSQNMNQGGKTTPEEFERMKRELKTWLQTGLPKVMQGLAGQQKTQQWYDNETNNNQSKIDARHRQIQQDAQDAEDSRYYQEMTRPQQYMGTNPLREGKLEQIVNNTVKKVLKESATEMKKKKKHN